MKKIRAAFFLIILFVSIGIFLPQGDVVKAEASNFTYAENSYSKLRTPCDNPFSVEVGKTYYLYVDNIGSTKDYTIESSDESVAKVTKWSYSSYTTLTIVKAGTATITATGTTGTAELTVIAALPTITVDKDNVVLTYYASESFQSSETVKTNFDIDSYSISDSNIVSVDTYSQSVSITPKAPGTAVITLKDKYEQSVTITVTVTVPALSFDKPEYVATFTSSYSTTANVTIDVNGESFGDLVLSDPTIGTAEKSSSGKSFYFKGTKLGTTTATITDAYGQTASCTITVNVDPTLIFKTNPTSITLLEGKSCSIRVYNGIGTVSAVCNDVNIAGFSADKYDDDEFYVVGKVPGITSLTFVDSVGQVLNVPVVITAKTPAPTIEMDSSLSVGKGKKQKIDVQFDADNYYLDIASWSSSNKKIATVDKNGVVTGKKEGKATITCKLSNGAKFKCKVTVFGYVASIEKSKQLTAGFSSKILVEYNTGAKKEKITWKSSNKSVATVTKNGTVKTKKAGKCKITATTKSGKKYTCKITVKENKWSGTPLSHIDPYSGSYGYVHLSVNKAYYKGGRLYLVCNVWNNRMFRASKFNWITIDLKDYEHNKSISKTFHNKGISLAAYGKKTITFDMGKRKIDLRNSYFDYEYYYTYVY